MRSRHPLHIAKSRYYIQKGGAKARGIPFLLTFEEWYQWFLDHGVDRNVPQPNSGNSWAMCRFGDQGAYELGNIYLSTQSQNVVDAQARLRAQAQRVRTPKGEFLIQEAANLYGINKATVWYRARRHQHGFELV